MPRVSVIVPVHNAMPHLTECLDSILNQTLGGIEVLCVNDGSTDDSLEVLREYAKRDKRVEILHQENGGAGAARNKGLDAAKGEYLSFLDADDSFEPTMLEDAYNKCISDSADIGLYRSRFLHSATGLFTPAEGLLKMDLLPESRPFSYHDIPDHALVFSSPAPWNKLFKRSFVISSDLRFQEIKRANDLLFTKLALVSAERITVIDKVLVNYRVGNESNLQAKNHESPLEFHKAHVALKDGLVERGVFEEVERGFVNLVLSNCLYNLRTLKTAESFNALYEKMRDEYFEQMGIDGRESDYFYLKRQYDEYLRIKSMSPQEYLLDELAMRKNRLQETTERLTTARTRLKKTEMKLTRIEKSRAYRLGRLITAMPRRLKQLASASRGAE